MINQIRGYILPAAFAILPPAMASDRATAMLLAIGLQESKFLERRQGVSRSPGSIEGRGPARGFWQFEVSGVRGVLEHPHSQLPIAHALRTLRYDHTTDPAIIHQTLEHNDVLAACFARCLLWTLPEPLPSEKEAAGAWLQYFTAWRPGKPFRATWDQYYAHAWILAQSEGIHE